MSIDENGQQRDRGGEARALGSFSDGQEHLGSDRPAGIAAYERLLRPLLFRLDAERAHNLVIRGSELFGSITPGTRIAQRLLTLEDERLQIEVAGIRFRNPLGLAAGFDKNGRALAALESLGFGHIEIGSVSARPSAGNPRPRVFRLPDDHAIVVHYGVPNDGSAVVARRLAARQTRIPLGVNIVKTNDGRPPSCDAEVFGDYETSLTLLHDQAAYVSLNMSCPNSAEDRDFFDSLPRVHGLLTKLSRSSPGIPVFLKLKPTLDPGWLRELIAMVDEFPFVAGFAINLPAGQPKGLDLRTPRDRVAGMAGAVSGPPVEDLINDVLGLLFATIGSRRRYVLMAAGGVSSAPQAYRKIQLGASLVQLYTGLIYQGPALVRHLLCGLVRLLDRDGFETVSEAVGSHWAR